MTDPASIEHQIARAEHVVAGTPAGQRLFLLVNVSALHQPNWFYAAGAARGEDSRASHAAALEYVDRHIGGLFDRMRAPLLRHRLLRPRHRVRRGRLHRPPARPRDRLDRAVRRVPTAMTSPNPLAAPDGPARTRAMSTPTRTRRPTGRSPRAPPVRRLGRRAPRRALPLRARAVLRDALRLLQPVHAYGRARGADDAYLDALERQADAVRDALGEASVRAPPRSAAARPPT